MWPWDLPLKFQILLGIVAVLATISVVYAGFVSHRRQVKHDPVEWFDEPRVIADWDEFSRAAQRTGPKVREQNEWIFRHFERKYPAASCSKCGSKLQLAYFAHFSIPPHGTTGYSVFCPRCKCEFGKIQVLTI